MSFVRLSGLYVMCILFIRIPTQASNDTTTYTTKHTGWHNGPAERSTMMILWSCLTTISACTWTFLSLPGTRRKAVRRHMGVLLAQHRMKRQ
ncbi:hypothetical protein B0T12DRAFT_419238 [Alternaria alternata]|nr:hypothetical protein B0T12DRAFT_419238 [Alternaria alternata]